MSTKQKKVPVVTYTLLETVETHKTQKEKQHKLEASYRATAKKQEVLLQKQKAEREKLQAEKKALREEIKRTHVIPSFVLEGKRAKKEEQKRVQEFAFVEQHRQKKLAEDILHEQQEWTFRMKQFKKEVRLAKVVPLVVNFIPEAFQESGIGKEYLLECGEAIVAVVTKLARVVGFDVESFECEGECALILKKPFPWWRYAFRNEKKEISHG